MLHNKSYNAKLLLTAEYLVLDGAIALAVPLRFGQSIHVNDNDSGFISWQSVAHDGSTWFSGKFAISDFSIIETSNPEMAKHPQRLMQTARKLNPDFCNNSTGNHVISTLNYPLLWGLGSSSTLIAAVAGWAEIDPFKLHFEVSGGSGYDIACAINDGPILYSTKNRIPSVQRVSFLPAFADKIFFVYQGKKQDSAQGIKSYKSRDIELEKEITDTASILTNRMLNAKSIVQFEQVMHEHESMISKLLGVRSIKDSLFYDLPGEVKSLGAWGGDFCMLTWNENSEMLKQYLKSKGLSICFNFSDIVL